MRYKLIGVLVAGGVLLGAAGVGAAVVSPGPPANVRSINARPIGTVGPPPRRWAGCRCSASHQPVQDATLAEVKQTCAHYGTKP